MGLDWNPVGKPLLEHQEEFERLFWLLTDKQDPKATRLQRLKGAFFPPDRPAAQKRFEEIQTSPYSTLGAPQVGFSEAATDWARLRYAGQPEHHKTESEFLKSMKGYYVLALVSPCDGLPWYTNGEAGYVEMCSFRAQWLKLECKAVLSHSLLELCYESCLAPELGMLGQALREAAVRFANDSAAMHVENLYELAEGSSATERRAHILFAAAKWCRWWSSRGHGLEAFA